MKHTEEEREEDAKTCVSAEEEANGSLKKRRFPSNGSTEGQERTNEESVIKRRPTYVPEIELGMWPKLVHLPGTSTNAETQRYRHQPIQQKIHRPWETKRERFEGYPIRTRAYLPINRFITTEFGHLGVRNQKFSNEGPCAFSRQFCKIGHEENWMLGPAQSYACYFGPYGRGCIPVPKEYHSCLPNEHQEYLLQGKRGFMGAFNKQRVGADRFCVQYPPPEQDRLKPIPRVKQSVDKESQTKRGVTTYWPKVSSENISNGCLKGQGVTSSSSSSSSSSPTFEYIGSNKAKDSHERPFNCTICDKSFKRRSSLATHKFIHTDLKPHVCVECNKRFLRKSDLKKHGLMHSGKKPYECEKCGRKFSQSSNMLTHLRRHMGIRPFECKICTRSFFRKVDLKRHEGRHIAKTLKTKCDTE